jgi:hypothetical protein
MIATERLFPYRQYALVQRLGVAVMMSRLRQRALVTGQWMKAAA